MVTITTVALRKKLTDYLKVADDKKLKAIYVLVEDDIEQPALAYTEELKTELDKRYAAYKKGEKLISAAEAKRQISKILAS